MQMQAIMQDLNSNRVGKSLDLESFRKEVIHRFEDIGWRVEVKTFETTEPGIYAFDFELGGRTHPHEEGTDWERFGWEVRKDVAGVEPEKKDFPHMPFNPEMLHTGPSAHVHPGGVKHTHDYDDPGHSH
jgi:hypothetical protein